MPYFALPKMWNQLHDQKFTPNPKTFKIAIKDYFLNLNGVVEFLFIIAVYLRIKDYSGMNIKNSTMLHTAMFNVFSNGNQSDNI